MDTKNVIAAISLSAAVIILYSLFFAPSPQEVNQAKEEKNKITQSSEAPSIEVDEKFTKIKQFFNTIIKDYRLIENNKFLIKKLYIIKIFL